MRFVCGVALAALCLLAANAGAGTVHPALQDQMDQIEAGQPVSAIVFMAEQAPIDRINEELKVRGATRLERNQTVVAALKEMRSTQVPLQRYLDDRIQAGDVLGYTSYWISNLVVVHAAKEQILVIAARPDVDLVEPNLRAELIEPIRGPQPDPNDEIGSGPEYRGGTTPGVVAINAPQVWTELGITGAGRLVANLDTGVDGNHPEFSVRWRGLSTTPSQGWLDVLGGAPSFPTDNHSHGTHVMGTITGNTVGVAWGAEWMASNAINQGVGGEFDNDVLTAYQWMTDPDGNPGTTSDVPDVCQNSWGVFEGLGYPDCDTRFWASIDNAEAAGIVMTYSAGNEGSGAATLRSPSDRATTLTNAFSIGAVDATNFSFPYPIAGFSSRGPSTCPGPPPENLVKPEVVAPGVDVCSSVPGGGYDCTFDGTSMSGPHVAGVVALMREANPDLDVDTIKMILMETAIDLGTAGEDNTYGWGLVDAFAAVQAATTGFGTLQGFVSNGSWSDAPVDGAQVELLESGATLTSDNSGLYSGVVAPGTYNAEVTHPSFQSAAAVVEVLAEEITIQDFSLTDILGPDILFTEPAGLTTLDTVGPYAFRAGITDYSTVTRAELNYRVNDGPWNAVPMTTFVHGEYSAFVAGLPAGSQIDYYVEAEDGLGLTRTEPETAPGAFRTLYVTQIAYAYDAEDPGDPDWTLGIAGDDADTGVWERVNPNGTDDGGAPMQPEDDHTADPGVQCFVTGQSSVGGSVGENDVDNGCTTLLSPLFDLSEANLAFGEYYRWYAMGGSSSDDEFAVDVSSNGGTDWFEIERVSSVENSWTKVAFELGTIIDLTDQVQFRFVACDINNQGITEAAIDDFQLEVFTPSTSDVLPQQQDRVTATLEQNRPNPANPLTTLSFRLSNPAHARLDIYDASGRHVRSLVNEELTAGAHSVDWDGLDDRGREQQAGVYFYRLKAGAFEQARRLTIVN